MSGYNKEAILEFFNKQQIPYEKKEHKAVFTMEEMQEQRIMEYGRVCKNLFLRNTDDSHGQARGVLTTKFSL